MRENIKKKEKEKGIIYNITIRGMSEGMNMLRENVNRMRWKNGWEENWE